MINAIALAAPAATDVPDKHPIYNWIKSLVTHDQLGEWLVAAGLKLAAAAALLLVGLWVARKLSRLSARMLGRTHTDVLLTNFLRHIVFAIVMAVVIVAALGALGVETTSLLAIMGAAGLAVGMALKDSLSNIASGIMLVTLRPFHVGDTVTISDKTGTVESVSIFQTVLLGADNQVFTIPNSLITTNSITNMTARPTRRIELVIGIGYADDIELARSTALEVVHADARVLRDPPPDVVVYELAQSTVNIGIRCFVSSSDWFAAKASIQEALKRAFDSAGISIPYPQRDLHLFLQKGATLAAADKSVA